MALLTTAALGACSPPTESPSPSPAPTATVAPPTPVAQPQVASTNLVPGEVPGDWRVVGSIENPRITGIESVELRVAVLDAANRVLEVNTIGPLLSNLAPGERSPFSVNFESVGSAVDAEVELLAYEASEFQRAELDIRLKEFFVIESGELAALGSVTNPLTRRVVLSTIGFLAESPAGLPALIAPMAYGPISLAPGETVNFIALAPEDPGLVRWASYHDGVVGAPSLAVGIELVKEPLLRFTPQGTPFVVGSLTNRGGSPVMGEVLISLYEGERLVSMLKVRSPLPLEPVEQLPFAAFGFPGFQLRRRSDDPNAFRVETRVGSVPVVYEQSQVLLPVDVEAFHSVGSVLFIRGSVRNPLDRGIQTGAVLAEARSLTGELLTAAWSSIVDLPPREAQEFVIELPLPEGVDNTLSEYDLRAIGLQAGP